jgi:17beta-estradiol 17-dehydrogenase / very-long-chain 3-oxoacyl-CoA reductase
MDFSKNKDEDYAKLKAIVDDLDVSVLINNVGRSHSIPVTFMETSQQEIADIININCFGTLRVTQIVAPGMIKNKRGLILTMGSFGATFPTPLLATYSGSNAFLQLWSCALVSELKPHGIQVELVLSYLVISAMSKVRKASWLIPTPKAFVRSTLGSIGNAGGAQGMAYTSTPFWSHAIMQWWLSLLGMYNGMVIDYNKGAHEDIRRRAIRKQEREAKKA